jgi:hypothetical protein
VTLFDTARRRAALVPAHGLAADFGTPPTSGRHVAVVIRGRDR